MRAIHFTLILFRITSLCLFIFTAGIRAGEPRGEKLAEPITQGQRVVTCGHSFHVWVPGIVTELAKAAGISGHVQVGVSSIGGSRVIQHWDLPDEKDVARKALIALREKIIAGQAPGLKSQEDLFTDELGHGTAPLKALVAYTVVVRDKIYDEINGQAADFIRRSPLLILATADRDGMPTASPKEETRPALS